jgi:hypothetical protein
MTSYAEDLLAAMERKKRALPLTPAQAARPSAARVGERFGSQRSNGSISVHEHARGRGLRADESEFARISTVRKEAFAQQDRVDEQQNLVDQSLLEQHGRQRRTSPDDQVRARPLT